MPLTVRSLIDILNEQPLDSVVYGEAPDGSMNAVLGIVTNSEYPGQLLFVVASGPHDRTRQLDFLLWKYGVDRAQYCAYREPTLVWED